MTISATPEAEPNSRLQKLFCREAVARSLGRKVQLGRYSALGLPYCHVPTNSDQALGRRYSSSLATAYNPTLCFYTYA